MSELAITAWAVLSAAGEGAANARITASARALWPAAPDRIGRMDRASAHALVVAQRALSRAGFERVEIDAMAVVVGTALGCAEVNERYDRALVERGSEGASPILFAQTIPSAPAGEIAIAFGLRAHAATVMAGRASAVAALVEARRAIALGRAERALVIAGDTLGPDRARLREARALRPAAEAVVALVVERPDVTGARPTLATLEHAATRAHTGGDDDHPDWLGASGAMELVAWLADVSLADRFEHEVRCASGRLGALRARR